MEINAQKRQYLLSLAAEAAKNAYCPYSGFHVGACILYEDNETFCGCNVENSSYGLSLCAERNVVSSAIAAGKKSKLLAVAIYSPDAKFCSPCGACRQWIAEFSPDAVVILEDRNGEAVVFPIKELLPHAFELL